MQYCMWKFDKSKLLCIQEGGKILDKLLFFYIESYCRTNFIDNDLFHTSVKITYAHYFRYLPFRQLYSIVSSVSKLTLGNKRTVRDQGYSGTKYLHNTHNAYSIYYKTGTWMKLFFNDKIYYIIFICKGRFQNSIKFWMKRNDTFSYY